MDLGLKGCLAVGGRLSILEKCAIQRHLSKEFKSSWRLDISGSSGWGHSLGFGK